MLFCGFSEFLIFFYAGAIVWFFEILQRKCKDCFELALWKKSR